MRPSSNSAPGLKKGAWTVDEDMLLKNCIEKYGEGKWHLIPLKAGLNRCRKSCRLRWLNYLRPNIKRGDFAEDEVDLILRLHKLLGNRWALIAGRIPGRTANDVKNYWNTRHRSRSKQHKNEPNDTESLQDTRVTIIKPQPQTFSKTMNDNPHNVAHDGGNLESSNNGVNNFNMSSRLTLPPNVLDEDINQYMDDLFDDHENDIDGNFGWSFGGFSAEGKALNTVEQEDDQISLSDIPMDEVTWELINSEQQLF
ncbi:hypothetical protein L2E82_18304 [Cichorium intybus]|uniref:Uncharacterized protein n=1 Tax=Cichorium intybus TaxID=13427 RepID=A0ACB9FA99_CICIN|nr:hypothetical protein L2E82_18304 [Cichorium intybus]